jgi:hypothetical protein
MPVQRQAADTEKDPAAILELCRWSPTVHRHERWPSHRDSVNPDSDFGYPMRRSMKAVRQFGLVLLLLASYLTPAMACMVSGAQMNAEERACCRAMKNQCGQMGMPASHGCCQKAPKSSQENAVATKAVTCHPVVVAVVRLSVVEQLNRNPVAAGSVACADTSPPQPPPSSLSVLRI